MVSKTDSYKTVPRLYVQASFQMGGHVSLPREQTHYLVHVMRLKVGDVVRLFNGEAGEWLGEIEVDTKQGVTVVLRQEIRAQEALLPLTVFFSPLRKHRQDFLVEKATELGVTCLCPTALQHTQVKGLRVEKIQAQVAEAAEQSERLSVPLIKPLMSLDRVLSGWDPETVLYVGRARVADDSLLSVYQKEKAPALLMGPEGGFSDQEIETLAAKPFVRFFSLGPTVLRAETAFVAALAVVNACRMTAK